jgi:pilus assembly protein Flp/PilA
MNDNSIIFNERRYEFMEAPSKKGQGMVEYALILVLVALVIFIAVSLLGSGVGNLYQTIVNSI